MLSVSTNLGTLAIDPTQSGSREKLLPFLADAVFEEFCTRNQNQCRSNLSTYLKQDLTGEKDITVDDLKKRI